MATLSFTALPKTALAETQYSSPQSTSAQSATAKQSQTSDLWPNLPLELRQLPFWCLANEKKIPLTINPETGAIARLDIRDTTALLTFEQASAAAIRAGVAMRIGFVLHPDNPYTCIDLDVKPTTTQSDFDRYWKIVQAFDSYTEHSNGGKGLHIWLRATIEQSEGKGIRRDGVEIYCQSRYIICTGNILLNKPVRADRQGLLNTLVAEITQQRLGGQPGNSGTNHTSASVAIVPLIESEPTESDEAILIRATSADNADKFTDLCNGEWQKYHFPSQSEADLALMSILAFYSASNEQCRRLFRMTALGARDKSTRNNRYLDYTLGLIRTRQAADSARLLSAESLARDLVASLSAARSVAATPQITPTVAIHTPNPATLAEVTRLQSAEMPQNASKPTALHDPTAGDTRPSIPPVSAAMALVAPSVAKSTPDVAYQMGIPWPPGLAGAIASFVYSAAPRPVREIAIVATLGFLAGVLGRSHSIPGSGLNLYVILVARSAIGKEAMHSGLSMLINAISSRQPGAASFLDFNDFASGPALQKACAANQSFCSVSGEWGKKLKRLANDATNDTAMHTLRTVMTNLYQKSSKKSIVGGITYSTRESSIASVSGVAFSMIGETTPSTFYECLTESMMEDGFLSRFTVISYPGSRPPLNANPVDEPPAALADSLAEMCAYATHINTNNGDRFVQRTQRCAEIICNFEIECDEHINGTDDECIRQVWNRASLKAMRIAALIASADNWINPVMDVPHIEWALTVVRKDIEMFMERLGTGDIGTSDYSRMCKMLSVMREYLTTPQHGLEEKMAKDGAISHRYLQAKLVRSPPFAKHKAGANVAIEFTLRTLMDGGYIQLIPKGKAFDKYLMQGNAYHIINLPTV